MTPQEFAQRLNRWYAGTMMQDMEMLHAGEGRAGGSSSSLICANLPGCFMPE